MNKVYQVQFSGLVHIGAESLEDAERAATDMFDRGLIRPGFKVVEVPAE